MSPIGIILLAPFLWRVGDWIWRVTEPPKKPRQPQQVAAGGPDWSFWFLAVIASVIAFFVPIIFGNLMK